MDKTSGFTQAALRLDDVKSSARQSIVSLWEFVEVPPLVPSGTQACVPRPRQSRGKSPLIQGTWELAHAIQGWLHGVVTQWLFTGTGAAGVVQRMLRVALVLGKF